MLGKVDLLVETLITLYDLTGLHAALNDLSNLCQTQQKLEESYNHIPQGPHISISVLQEHIQVAQVKLQAVSKECNVHIVKLL